jgi:hypothetical protein
VALRRRAEPLPPPLPEPSRPPRSLVASAAKLRLDGQGWRTWQFGDDNWQQEAWRLYDVIGELRFIANWIGSACSRVRIYVAEVDQNGRIQQEVTDKKIGGLSDTLFNGPAGLAEALRLIGINLTITGDVYVVGRPGQDQTDAPAQDDYLLNDSWMVLSGSELRRFGPRGQKALLIDRNGLAKQTLKLDPTTDLIIRIWTPHPRRGLWADSPTRGAMPMLYEIERLTRYVFAQIDSRLVSAGLLPIPQEISFPDHDPELSPSEALTNQLMRAGSASLKGEGTAAGVMPTVVEVPMEALGKIELVNFGSELSHQALELRNEAIRRMALAMDIDPSILSGMENANHWGAWQIFSGQIKIHIEPLMTRICDGLTTAYLRPALSTMKDTDPERYVYWFDTAPLEVRPQRLQDTQGLYRDRIISSAAVLREGDYKISDAPDSKEDTRNFVRDLMMRNPNLIADATMRKAAELDETVFPPNVQIQVAGAGGPMPPPPPPDGISAAPAGTAPPDNSTAQNALSGPGGDLGVPSGSNANGSPIGMGGTPNGVTASAGALPPAMNLFTIANATVLRVMERAGKKMLTRATVGKFPDTPAHELHTQLPDRPDQHMAFSLLEGSWDQMPYLAEAIAPGTDVGVLKGALEGYCAALLMHRQPHDVQLLGDWLRQRGLLHGSQ